MKKHNIENLSIQYQDKKVLQIVCGIIKMKEGYLIAKRATGEHQNIWEFPGGKVEQNETQEQAIEREIKEELELDVKVEQKLMTITDEREDCILYVTAYVCKYMRGNVVCHAHHEVRYVKARELFSYSFEKADTPILEALQGEGL